MDTPIVIEFGDLTKIEPGCTYVLTIRAMLSKLSIEILQNKFKEETGARLILMVGIE